MRNPDTTKHDYGHALLIAGAYGRCGCAILAAKAALRSGCGLVSVHLPRLCVDPMQTAFPEAMVSLDASNETFSSPPTRLEHYNAIAAGPGIGTSRTTAAAMHDLLAQRPKDTPLVLDADALNILSAHKDWLSLARGAAITPHAREYERLFGDADPATAAAEYGLTIVKKAHRTHVYAPDGRLYVNDTGNAGMATAGSGDVLTGILLGMAAQQPQSNMFNTACLAVRTHGQIGDIAIQKQSESSLTASDLVENLRNISVEVSTI